MALKSLCLSLAFFSVAMYLQGGWIAWMHRIQAGEAIKNYGPESHLKKRGTPTMGGIVAFVLAPFAVLCAHMCGAADIVAMAEIWSYAMLVGLVGLIDDLLKYKTRTSEGLRSLQKLCLQIVVSIPWALYLARDGVYIMPWWQVEPALGASLLVFIGVGFQNAVNVTDGLDGLAGGAVAISLVSLLLMQWGGAVSLSAAIGISLILAFLWYNANPAKVFMGDVGAHFWAGLLIGLCVASRSLLLIVPIGFLFGIELVTVAIQIVAIRKFHRKVFRMSPLHHHFELLGWREQTIVTRFWLAHIVGMAAILILILTLREGGIHYVGS